MSYGRRLSLYVSEPVPIAILFFIAASASSQPAPLPTTKLTLDACIDRALRNFPQVKQAEMQIRVQQAQYDQAFWAWFTPIEVSGQFGGPTPEAYGNGQFLRTESSLQGDSNIGRPGFYAGYRVQGAIPIFTFGKLSALRGAASSGVQIARDNTVRVQNELRANVSRAFLGYTLAASFLQLVDDNEKILTDAISTAQDMIKKKSDQVSDTDIYMLRTLLGQLRARRAEAQQGADQAKELLRFLMNLDEQDNFAVDTVDLDVPAVVAKKSFDFETYAQHNRPEARMAEAAIKVRANALGVRRAFLFPDLAIAGFLVQNYTSNQDFQRNPFLNNQGVDFTGGIGLAARYTLDIPTKLAQMREAEAELHKAELDSALLQKGVTLQVRKAFADAIGTWNQAAEYVKAEKSGKSWVVSSTLNFESGLAPANELFQAIRAFSESGASRRKAQFDFGMARVELAEALGTDLKTVNDLWRESAKE
jgi:outer membrane protein TolC